MVAGVLSILLAALFVVGSLLHLGEFRLAPDPRVPRSIADRYHQTWGAWSFSGSGLTNQPAHTQQLLGISMIVAAVALVIGGLLLITGLTRRFGAARAVTAAGVGMAIGLAVTLVVDIVSMLHNNRPHLTMSLGPGFWVFVVSVFVAFATLACVLFGGISSRAAAPVDSTGRPLARRIGGLEITVGVLLVPLAGLLVAATFTHQIDGDTLWTTWNHKVQFAGAPVVFGAFVALVSAVLSFVGRGRTAGSISAGALFGCGLLLVLNTVDQELFGPVGFGDLGVGAWLLFVATALALIVTVLAIASAAAKPRYRTPYAPVAQQHPGWSPSAPQQPVPVQQGWPSVPPGWVLVPEGSVQARQGWTPPIPGPPEGAAPSDQSR
ncbi:hypothetical protein ACFXHA_43795 [Nocardia sp. NPDC059240]|uniref:hypothetical protein n=1 Tax=Nocardia sp. NPDC059240 TaxID=3346786 RepID=UPI00367C3021